MFSLISVLFDESGPTVLGYRITIFRLYGFDVHVDVSWFILSVLILWTLAVEYFPSAMAGLPSDTYWQMGVAGLIGLCFSILMHEVAHALVAKYYKMEIGDITLWIFGGVADMEEQKQDPKREGLMAAAGPAMSLLLAGAFYALFVLVGGYEVQTPISTLIVYLMAINLILAFFNMIPAFPLDGGRILRAALWAWRRDRLWATRMASYAGSALAFCLAAIAMIQVMHGHTLNGLWIFLMSIFITVTAGSSVRDAVTYSLFAGNPVSRFMRREVTAVAPQTTVEELIEDYVYQQYLKTFPVVHEDTLMGYVSVDAIRGTDRKQWPWKTVADYMQPLEPEQIVHPESDAGDALERMRRRGDSNLIVTDKGRLIGLISMRDLLHLLNMKQSLEPLRTARGEQ